MAVLLILKKVNMLRSDVGNGILGSEQNLGWEMGSLASHCRIRLVRTYSPFAPKLNQVLKLFC